MNIVVKQLGVVPFEESYAAMREFNQARTSNTTDEIWLLQHPPVYTLGLAGSREHIMDAGNIPVIETDRGGQVTYHGPGQLVAYLLIDLSRRPYSVKRYVSLIEAAIIDYLDSLGIEADRKSGAPGVYVSGKKIAALGVRVKQKGSYHGLAINVDMDISPFENINPCGYADLQCTQISEHVDSISMESVCREFPRHLLHQLDQLKPSVSEVA